MTGPDTLKRNLTILALYDSGDYSRHGIYLKLNLSSVHVVHYVIRNRSLYENDPRRTQMFHLEQSSKILKNPQHTK